jgi:hypothetical protein
MHQKKERLRFFVRPKAYYQIRPVIDALMEEYIENHGPKVFINTYLDTRESAAEFVNLPWPYGILVMIDVCNNTKEVGIVIEWTNFLAAEWPEDIMFLSSDQNDTEQS